jgi:hypothetical protein
MPYSPSAFYPGRDKQIVRAEFRPGGKQYHYRCEGAQIGDVIRSLPNGNPCTVVGYGRDGYNGSVRYAEVIRTASMSGLQATIPIKRGQPIPETSQQRKGAREMPNKTPQSDRPVIPASKATLLALAKSPNATIGLTEEQREVVRPQQRSAAPPHALPVTP